MVSREDEQRLMSYTCAVFLKKTMLFVLRSGAFSMMAVYTFKQEARSMESLKGVKCSMFPPYLVKRRKQHFHHLDQYGIDLILGCNGFIWIGEHVNTKNPTEEEQASKSEQEQVTTKFNTYSASHEEQERTYTPPEIRQNICRMANAARVLSTLGFSITLELLTETANLSMSLIYVHEMLGSEFCVLVAEGEAERRSTAIKRK